MKNSSADETNLLLNWKNLCFALTVIFSQNRVILEANVSIQSVSSVSIKKVYLHTQLSESCQIIISPYFV